MQRRGEVIKTLSETTFALDDATAEEIEANPKALSRLAAHVYLTALENANAAFAEQMNQNLPVMVDALLTQRKSQEGREDQFYSAFPALKDHAAKINEMAPVFRQLQPTLSPDDFIKQFGEYAHLALGVAKPQAAPAAPTPRAIAPHTPIGAGVSHAAPVKPSAPSNPFAALAGERGQVGVYDDDPDDA